MDSMARIIRFESQDGWEIEGVLHLPAAASSDHAVPAALLLHGASHDREAFASFVYPGMAQILSSQGVAALRIDWRGRGQSLGSQEYHSFTEDQKANVYLDVKQALQFIAEQPEIDRGRLAVFAEEVSAEWAVLGSKGNPNVRALGFISGNVSPNARDTLASMDIPILCIVSNEDKRSVADMSAIYAASTNDQSQYRVYENMGMGTTMFTLWRYKYPDRKGVEFLSKQQGVDTEKIGLVARDPGDEKPIENVICDWLAARLKSLGRLTEVSFDSDGGWTIHGNLVVPETLGIGELAPAVVLLHSGWSDRYSFHDLERKFARAGIAVLNIDWRGRGKSRNKGNFFELSREERDNISLDAKAAVNFVANQRQVDSRRIGILGAYLGAKYAAMAAIGDSRIGAVVMLTGFIPSSKEQDQIAGAGFPILFVGSRGLGPVTNSMKELYELTVERGSEFILYEGGALGNQLLEIVPGLDQRIVGWVKRRLANN